MNSLYTSNKAFFSQLFLGIALLSHSLYGITVHDKPLEQIIQPGQTLIIKPQKKGDFLLIEMKDGNIYSTAGDLNALKNIEIVFEELNSKISCSIQSRTCNISSNTVNYNGSYLMGRERINIKSRTSLNLIQCLLESPDILITGNQMNFRDCFLINPQVLCIIANSPESDCQMIRITFDEESTYPTLITGELDLENNQISRDLLLTNVKEIEFQFSPKVWEN